ncbi:MAG TPA: hypothetical protein VI976_03150 [Candidatus Omnitrophota bacterium]|nr:hypothetical protein [Candidatus Omnitrophota bacterium]
MKLKLMLLVIIFFITPIRFSLSQDETLEVNKQPLTCETCEKDKGLEVEGPIKAEKGLCLGDNCKTEWPKLKCADYSKRPKGESGDGYCQNLNKACTAVILTSPGASYFEECSNAPIAPHKTRCCWVE